MNEVIMTQAEPVVIPALYGWGIDVIRFIQSFQSPLLTSLMKFISSIGNEAFYIIIIMLIFWCWNEKKGFLLGLLLCISAWINSFLKVIFDHPRPYEFDPAVGLAFEPTRGFPSGHAQNSMTFWIALAFILSFSLVKRKNLRPLIWGFSSLIILLIGLSRLYLGVHFPTDVFFGWLVSLIILAAFYFLEKPASLFFARNGKRPQRICAAAAALLMNMLLPQDTSLAGLLLGFCLGYSLMLYSFPFSAQGVVNGKTPGLKIFALRAGLGLIGTLVIFIGLRLLIPGENSILSSIDFFEPYYELGRFIRYGLLGFWASAGAIRVFQNTGLA